MTSVCAASLLAAAGGSGSLAGDLIPQRPAVEDARVLLYEGQKTPLGTIESIRFDQLFSLGRDRSSYAVVNMTASGESRSAMIRYAPGSTEPELVVASGAVTTTGETIEQVGQFALLPSTGAAVAYADIRAPGESSSRLAIVRVDAPDSIAVLLRAGDPAPPPLDGTLRYELLGNPFNAVSDTHFVGLAFIEREPSDDYIAILRVSVDGVIEVIAAEGLDGMDRVDVYPQIGPDGEAVFGASPTPIVPGDQPAPRLIGGLQRVSTGGETSTLVWTGDPVPGTPREAFVDRVLCSATSGLFFPDAYFSGADGEVYTTAFLATDLSTPYPTALLRVTESETRAILNNIEVDPTGQTHFYPIVRPFKGGSFVSTRGARSEVWYADSIDSRVVVDASTVVPGFATGSVLSVGFGLDILGPHDADLIRDRIVFSGSVSEPPGPTSKRGIFTLSEFGELELLVRTGDAVRIGQNDREIAYPFLPVSNSWRTDDASGQVLFRAQMTDGDDALVRLVRVVHDINPEPCPGDVDFDRVVNFADLNAVLSNFGAQDITLPADLNASGVVDFADLNLVLSAFGAQCD